MRTEDSTLPLPAHALGAGQLVAWGAAFYSLPALLPRIAAERGISLANLSLAVTCGLGGSALGSVLVPGWIERYGARTPMVAGTLTAIFALAALAFDSSTHGTFFALFVLGASYAALLYEPLFAIIAAHTREASERVRSAQIVTLWGGFAGLWAIPATSLLSSKFGTQTAVLAMALSLLYPLHLHARLPSAAARQRTSVPARRSCSSGTLLLAFSMSTLAITSISVHGPAWLARSGVDEASTAWTFALLAPAQIVGRLWLLRQGPDRVRETASVPFVLIALGLVSLLVLPSPWQLAAFVAAFGAGSGLVTTTRAALLSTGETRQVGIAGLSTHLSRAAAPTCAAWLHASIGYGATLVTLATIAMLAASLLRRATAPDGCCVARGCGMSFG